MTKVSVTVAVMVVLLILIVSASAASSGFDADYRYTRSSCEGGVCDVWAKHADDPWELCRRDVPKSIPNDDVECLSALGRGIE